jgi:predicted enzyme related to lactoylglutathione lyase
MQQSRSATKTRVGIVHWIDHYVVCSEDIPRWAAFNEIVLGAENVPDPHGRIPGVFQNVGRIRHGAFIARHPLPPRLGLGSGLPRYGWYVDAADIDAHLRRLEQAGAVHGQPVHTMANGEAGTAILWQDPDGNQFEFWAPDVMPAGAMTGCSSARVGRISHVVLESRDLARTADFCSRYWGLERVEDPNIADDTLVMRLGGGARIIYKKVARLAGWTTGMGLRDAHTALLLAEDDFFPNYRRIWNELPEFDFDPDAGKPIENPEQQPARTVLHPSPAGRRFHALVGRGDDFMDWDTNLFHFYGGTPIDGSLAVYDGRPVEDFIDAWQRERGTSDGFKEMVLEQ